jgi:DNA-binding response OmpR family regulator
MSGAFARVLVVERNAGPKAVEDGLRDFGFDVQAVDNGRAAPQAVLEWQPEVLVLHADASGIDCLSLIASLRRLTEAPIVVVSARSKIGRSVEVLSRGADDYIVEPVDIEELAARLQAHLRRPRMETRTVVRYADLIIDITCRKAMRAGTPIELSAKEFDLLLTLARNPQKVLTRSKLLDLVWGMDCDVTNSAVETYISYLRSKLDVAGTSPLIHTVRGVGYTMRAVEERQSA